MDASKFIGRVGALAVALGVGAAMTTGAGIALAEGDSGSSSSGNSGSSTSGESSSNPSASTGAETTGSASSKSAQSTRPSLSDSFRNAISSAVSNATESRRSSSSTGADKAASTPNTTDSSSRNSRWQARLKQSEAKQASKPAETPAAKVETPAAEPPAVQTPAPQSQGDSTTPPAGTPAAAKAPQLSDIADRITQRFQERTAKLSTVVEKSLVASSDKPAGSSDLGSAVERVTSRKTDSLVRVYSGPAPELGRGADEVTTRVSKLADVDVDATSLSSAFAAASKVVDTVSAPVTAFVTSASTPPQLANLVDLGEIAKPAANAAATVMSSLLVVAGLSPLAGTGPAAPAGSPLAWALAAFARRESEKEISEDDALKSAVEGESLPTGDQPFANRLAAAVAAINPGQVDAPTVPTGVLGAERVGPVTGVPTAPWVVGGTDLGIMWDGGYNLEGKPVVYVLFGDTFNEPAMQNGWRNNVLFRTWDNDLTNGLDLYQGIVTPGGKGPGTFVNNNVWWGPDYPGNLTDSEIGAGQVILDPFKVITKGYGNDTTYLPWGFTQYGKAYTMIPTAGIAIPGAGEDGMVQYATVMSIKEWGEAGHWTTNYSAIAKSTDGGKTWEVLESTVREPKAGNEKFQQNALTYGDPEDPNSWVGGTPHQGDRYVYVYGTPAGRQGSAYLARVAESDFDELDKYEYYAGGNNWTPNDPSKAVVVFDSMEPLTSVFPESGILGFFFSPVVGFLKLVYPAGFKPGGTFAKGGQGNVSEMSVQYNEFLDAYVVMYTDGDNNVVMKVSETPQGAWSDSVVVQKNVSGYYAPMIHPQSGKPGTEGGDQYLYYNLSHWNGYNVDLMRTDLTSVKASMGSQTV